MHIVVGFSDKAVIEKTGLDLAIWVGAGNDAVLNEFWPYSVVVALFTDSVEEGTGSVIASTHALFHDDGRSGFAGGAAGGLVVEGGDPMLFDVK